MSDEDAGCIGPDADGRAGGRIALDEMKAGLVFESFRSFFELMSDGRRRAEEADD